MLLLLKGLGQGDIAGVGVLGLREAKICTDLKGNVVTALSGGGLVQEDDLSVGILVLGGPTVGKLTKLSFLAVLRIRDVYPGSRMRLFPSRIRIFFQKWFQIPRKYDPGCSSQIRIPDPDPDFLPGGGSRGQKPESRIRIRNTPTRYSKISFLDTIPFKKLYSTVY